MNTDEQTVFNNELREAREKISILIDDGKYTLYSIAKKLGLSHDVLQRFLHEKIFEQVILEKIASAWENFRKRRE